MGCTGSGTLSYNWSYVGTGADGVNQGTVTFSSTTSATPTVTGAHFFGSLNLQVIVTDTGGPQIYEIHEGVVIVGQNGFINQTAEGVAAWGQTLIGPMAGYQMGTQLQYPYADLASVNEINYQSCMLGIFGFTSYCVAAAYAPDWLTPQAGTLTIAANSATVTGSGTSFQSSICTGTSLTANTKMWVQYTGTDGITDHKWLISNLIASCPSNTSITLVVTYPNGSTAPAVLPNCISTPANCTGLSWGIFPANSAWLFTNAPANYYDNTEQAIRTWYRTGFDTAYTMAKTYATYWAQNPVNDYGYSCAEIVTFGGGGCMISNEPRSYSASGQVLAGLAGMKPGLLDGTWAIVQWAGQLATTYFNTATGSDIRDGAYITSLLASCTALATGATQSNCQSDLTTLVNTKWSAMRKPITYGGITYHPFEEFTVGSGFVTSITAAPFSGGGSACVVNGSTAVVGTGTTWNSAGTDWNTNGTVVWFFPTPGTQPSGVTGGDGFVNLIATVNSDTSITLAVPYPGVTQCTGTSGSNAGFTVNPVGGIVAWSFQPYMEGMLSEAFGHAAAAFTAVGDPTNAAIAKGYAHDAALAVVGLGLNPDNGGVYNVAGMAGCNPGITTAFASTSGAGPTLAATCIGWNGYNLVAPYGIASPSQSRQTSFDDQQGLVMDCLNTPSVAVCNGAASLMGQIWCKTGTCNGFVADGNYVAGFEVGGYFISGSFNPTGNGAKYNGQSGGFSGGVAAWPGYLASQATGHILPSGIITGGMIAKLTPDQWKELRSSKVLPRHAK